MMKREIKLLSLLLLGGALFTACNSAGTSPNEAQKDSTSVSTNIQPMNYPYTIDHPDNWEIGSQQNTMIALASLKAWENKNIGDAVKFFADSVHIRFDGIDQKVSNDTLKSMITPSPMTKNYSIKMQDWESVISKDKTEEYVTLWYREYKENTNGKKDSMDVVNDLKMKDGKIIGLDQYIRRLHK